MFDIDPTNEGQAAFWGGPGASHWVQGADLYDAQLEPFIAPVIEGADLSGGDSVIDIGCGTGAVSRAAAKVVGEGSVIGYDISESMVSEARLRSGGETRHRVADAQIEPFTPGGCDVVISRFGVMFFGDPVVAFANLASATRRGGRLSFVCWQDVSANEWMSGPGHAVAPILGPPPEPEPGAPGPFSLADPDLVAETLDAGGWTGIEVEAFTPDLYVSGPGSLDQAVEFMMGRTAIASILADRPPDDADAVRTILCDVFEPHHDGVGVRFNSAAWAVRALRR